MENKELMTDKWIYTITKNGRVKVTLNEIEIYKSLRDFGLRFANVDKVGHFYFRQDGIKVANLLGLRDLVWDKLEKGEFPNKNLTLNAYLKKNPIRKGEALKRILRDNLTDGEKHIVKIQVDIKYQKKTEIEETIKELEKLNFTKVIDEVGNFGNMDIYFKQKLDQEFIVLSHYCKGKDILKQGFDCWRTTYKRDSDIGIKKPLTVDSLRLSFHLNRDVELIMS